MNTITAYAVLSYSDYRGCPITDFCYLFPEEPSIVPLEAEPHLVYEGEIIVRMKNSRWENLPWKVRQIIEEKKAPIFLSEADAQAALAPRREEYDAYMTLLRFRQGECDAATRPYVALLEAQAARLSPAPRLEDTEGRVRFTFTEREKHLLAAKGIPCPYGYGFLRYPPSIESTPEFIAKWIPLIQERVKEITTAVDFLTLPEITTLFPE